MEPELNSWEQSDTHTQIHTLNLVHHLVPVSAIRDLKQDILRFKCLVSSPEAFTDLCTGCPGSGLLWFGPCCQVGSAAAICVGGVLVSEAGSSEASPVPADEPPPLGNCLTPTHTHTHLYYI